MATKKRKKRKKSRYHTGIHNSPKCTNPINYRSGWEKTICDYLDENPKVKNYAYECVEIAYTSNKTTKKLRKYLPDFIVWYVDGTVKMVEVKRQSQVTNDRVVKKAEAARIWCANQNPPIVYEFWTDKMILPLQRAAKLRAKVTSKKSK